MSDINFEETLKNALEVIARRQDIEREYFELLRKDRTLSPFVTIISPKLIEMKMEDQILALRAIVQLGEVAKYLCNKYNLASHEETEDIEE